MIFRGVDHIRERIATLHGIENALQWWPPKEQTPSSGCRVGFLATAYLPIGGTETLHRTLLPRLRSVVDLAGFVSTATHGGDGEKLEVNYATGSHAARLLAAHCDIIVTWGVKTLAQILPAQRPKVIAVHHADWSSGWSNELILNQLDLTDAVICVNEDTASRLSSCGKPVHYIPNAIDPQRICPSGKQSELRSRWGISPNAKILLFGHRLSAEKRPTMAVEIAKALPDDWVLVIAGDGPERNAVEAIASDRVRIVGPCDSLADWLSISSCFLSLSTFEGFGLAIGEAMAAGVPTVSTSTGIAPGLAATVPTDASVDEWARAIVNEKPIVSPRRVLDLFNVERMVEAWAGVIAQIAPKKGH
jgi:glycosyltransferase involved in cell wall biosynthesis